MPGFAEPNWPTRVYAIRFVDYRYIVNLLAPIGVQVSGEPNLNAISVRGPDKTLDAVDDIIKRFDIAANTPKNVELVVHVLMGSPDPETDPVPATIRPVVEQLRKLMAYKSYRVLDTIMSRGTEGSTIESSGAIPKLADTDRVEPTYNFRVRPRVVGEGTEQTIHLDSLGFSIRVFLSNSDTNLNIGTALDVKKGQQVVVGKATVRDRALILVLSAEVVN
jgi:hypothetical protein